MEAVKLKIPKRLEAELQRRRKRRLSRPALRVPPLLAKSASESSDEASEDKEKLQWRPVPRSRLHTGFDDAAVLTFEEIDDVDVIYEDVEGGGRVAKLAVRGYSIGC